MLINGICRAGQERANQKEVVPNNHTFIFGKLANTMVRKISFNNALNNTNIVFCFFLVPIIPEFLYDIRHPDAPLDSFPRTPLTTPRPTLQPCDRDLVTTDGTETTTSSAGKNVLPL